MVVLSLWRVVVLAKRDHSFSNTNAPHSHRLGGLYKVVLVGPGATHPSPHPCVVLDRPARVHRVTPAGMLAVATQTPHFPNPGRDSVGVEGVDGHVGARGTAGDVSHGNVRTSSHVQLWGWVFFV